MTTNDSIFLGLGTIALVASAGVIGVKVFSTNADQTTQTTSSVTSSTSSGSGTSSSTNSATDSSSSSNATYADGTYSATVSYQVPRGNNSLTATVTISGGEIASVDTANSYNDRESEWYINDFESSLSSDATGESLASYSPSRIGGASLTTWAFNDALDQIRSDAAA